MAEARPPAIDELGDLFMRLQDAALTALAGDGIATVNGRDLLSVLAWLDALEEREAARVTPRRRNG